MKKTTPAVNRTDRMFRAFSDRTRLRILSLLQDGECCVGDLVKILEMEQPSTSRHLAYLRKAGLVEVRQAGLWKFYSLAPACGAFHAKLLECLACCFQEVPEIQADQARARKLTRSGGCCPESTAPRQKARKSKGCCEGE